MEIPFKLLLISPEGPLNDEVETVIKLFTLGLESYHLRKPSWNQNEIQGFLRTFPQTHLNKIVLHSHFELASKFNLKGIHLNEDNKKLVSHLQNQNIISASFHSIPELKENLVPYQYMFLSPVFNSISKEGYIAKFDLKTLASELSVFKKQKPGTKIIAVGGVNAQNIMSVKQAGFSGAALLGAVWQSENPVQALLEIQSKINAH
jgi:thiamine-phosphate pyrophosphorylase